MKVGFIGAGKVGFSLGKYFTNHGIELTGYFSKSKTSAQEAALFTQSKSYNNIKDIVADSDTLFITVPDGEIKNIWDHMKNLDIQNKNICHSSGSMMSTVFFDGEKLGASCYSIHPLYAISDKKESWKSLANAYFTIEGSQNHMEEMKGLFKKLGNKLIEIPTENKALYHLAAAMVSNLVTGLFDTGANLLTKCGFTKEEASEALSPLFIGNGEAICQKGVVSSLTGPVERGDITTIEKHIEALKKINDNDDELLYVLLTEKLIAIAKEKHKEKDYTKLMEVITNEKHSCNNETTKN